MLFGTLEQTVELGWDFYLPVIMFVVLCALAVPVWASIGVAAITMLYMSGDLPLELVGESLFSGIDAFALTAVPLFILTGDLMNRGGVTRALIDLAMALVGRFKGGLGHVNIMASVFFAIYMDALRVTKEQFRGTLALANGTGDRNGAPQ